MNFYVLRVFSHRIIIQDILSGEYSAFSLDCINHKNHGSMISVLIFFQTIKLPSQVEPIFKSFLGHCAAVLCCNQIEYVVAK